MSNIQHFGLTSRGEDVSLITLHNGGISCRILSFGATLQSLTVPDRKGLPTDIVLGYDSLREYETQDGYLGAVVGRYANRIAKGRFELNGTEYTLAINNGPNHLHGGMAGFSHRVWTVEEAGDDFVRLSLESHDGEEGYPGKLKAIVSYRLQDNALVIRYEAHSDKDTLCNLTNHSYFNMSGHKSGPVLQQEIMLNAEHYTPTDADSIPYGDIVPVEGTPMDLRSFTKIGTNIDCGFIQLVQGLGYDHNYVLSGDMGSMHRAAVAKSELSGICMKVETTLPGLQFYSGNFLDEGRPGKDGAAYGPRHGFCLETQFFPDSPNKPGFPSAVLKAGEKFDHSTVFTFSNI